MKNLVHTLLACLLGLSAACAAPHIVAPPLPAGYAPGRPAFDGVTLYVRNLTVTDMGHPAKGNAASLLRPSLVAYLKSHTQFADVRTDSPAKAPPGTQALIVDVSVGFDRTSYRTYVLDALFVYPGLGFLPIPTPHWGTATVKVSGLFVDAGGRALWQNEATGKNDYSTAFYSWYRVSPYEHAYQDAFAKAFSEFASGLGGHRDQVMAALGAAPASNAVASGGGSIRAQRNAEAELMSALPLPPAAAPTPAPVDYKYTGPRLKVAVMPSQADASTSLPKVFDDYVLTEVQNTGNFETIGQDDIAALLGLEQQKDALGCDDASCMANIGGALGVDLMVLFKVSRVSKLGDGNDDWAISCKLLNARNPRVEARTNAFVHGDRKALLEQVGPLVRKLFSLRKEPSAS